MKNLILPDELKKRVVTHLGLGEDKHYILLSKDKSRPQLRYGKKYRVEGNLPFERLFTSRLPCSHTSTTPTSSIKSSTLTIDTSTPTSSFKRRMLQPKLDLFFDRFTYHIHFDDANVVLNNHTGSSKWLDVVVMCKNKRSISPLMYSSSSPHGQDRKGAHHAVIYVAVVGMSAPVPIKEREKQRLHEDFLTIFYHRNRSLFTEIESSDAQVHAPLFKVVIPQVQSAAGLCLAGYTSNLGDFEEVFDTCLQHCLGDDEHEDETQSSKEETKPGQIVLSGREREELKLRYYHAISQHSPIAIPVYATVPPYDDPLPLPMIVCCYPLLSGIMANNSHRIENGSDHDEPHSDGSERMLSKLIKVRSGLTCLKVRHPGSELQSSIIKSSYGFADFAMLAELYGDNTGGIAGNSDSDSDGDGYAGAKKMIDLFNLDIYDNEEITHVANPSVTSSFIACFAVSKDGRYVASLTSDHELVVRYTPREPARSAEVDQDGEEQETNALYSLTRRRLLDLTISEDKQIIPGSMDVDVYPCCLSIHHNAFEHRKLTVFVAYTDGSLRKYVLSVNSPGTFDIPVPVPGEKLKELTPLEVELCGKKANHDECHDCEGEHDADQKASLSVDINVILCYDENRVLIGNRNGELAIWDVTPSDNDGIGEGNVMTAGRYASFGCCDHHELHDHDLQYGKYPHRTVF